MKVKKLEYHRNGVGGEGFFVGIVTNEEDSKQDMLVVRFPHSDEKVGGIHCAVFDCALVGEKNIGFGVNSWRGDHYADVMDEAIKKFHKDLDKKLGIKA